MDNNQKILDAVSGALREAGYTGLTIQNGGSGTILIAKKGVGGAYFAVTDKPKEQEVQRTTGGGLEAFNRGLEVSAVPTVADLRQQLLQNPALARAFGISSEAIAHLK